jgi:NAD(P)-dependent dehydrogenase (short-subunit alcohol dehydrogenase family)
MSETPKYKQPMLPGGALEGKVAIVTGGATGLGKAMANEYARLGANIVIASRKQENLDKAADEISKQGTKVLTVQTDVRQPDQVQNMVDATVKEFGKVDILVNNAAGNFTVNALYMSVNAWNAVVNIVLNGTWYCSQTVAKQMVKQGHGGAMLNVGATYAWTGGPLTAHSAAAKAGVLALTKTLAVEWAPYDIRLNMITPGPIEETGAVTQLWPTPEAAAAVLAGIPLRRLGTPQEVANLASYLVSDYASYVTGACFVIDAGGWLNKGRFVEG